MTIAATQTTRVFIDVPGARTLNEAAARLTDPGNAGGGFLVIRTEVGGIHFEEVGIDAAVGAVAGAELVSQLRPLEETA